MYISQFGNCDNCINLKGNNFWKTDFNWQHSSNSNKLSSNWVSMSTSVLTNSVLLKISHLLSLCFSSTNYAYLDQPVETIKAHK